MTMFENRYFVILTGISYAESIIIHACRNKRMKRNNVFKDLFPQINTGKMRRCLNFLYPNDRNSNEFYTF